MERKIRVYQIMLYISLVFLLYSTGFGWQFIQMTDTHIGDQAGNEKFKEVIPAFNALQPQPDFIINTGDLTETGTEAQFSLYTTLIHQINIPVYSVMGNHEVRWTDICKERFVNYLGKRYYSFDHNGLHFAVLDGTIPLQHHGHFYRTQLNWLKEDLARLKKRTPIILAMHHPPASDGRYIDNDTELFEVIRPYNVVAMLVGHGHINQIINYENIPILMTKATKSGGYKIYDVGTKGITAYAYEIGKPIATDTIQIPLTRIIPPESSSVPETPEANILWKTRIADGLQFRPAVGEGKLFYGTEPGELYALDAKSGKQVWKKKVKGAIIGSPAYAEGNIYIAATDGTIYSFRAKDGEPNWKFQTGSAIIASPTVNSGILYVGSGDKYFYALDGLNGTLKWKFKCQDHVSSRALVNQGKVYFGSWDGNAYCLDAYTGATCWVDQIGKSIYWAPSVTEPILSDNNVIYTALEWIDRRVLGRVYALNALSGETVWAMVTHPCQTNPAADVDKIYDFGFGGEITALDAKTGNKVWSVQFKQAILASDIVINNNNFYIPVLTGELAILNPTDGKEIQRVPISRTGFLLSGPVIDNGICYQSAFDGTVVAFPINQK